MKIKSILLTELIVAKGVLYSQILSIGDTLDGRIIAKIDVENNTASIYDIDNDLIACLYTVKGYFAFKGKK